MAVPRVELDQQIREQVVMRRHRQCIRKKSCPRRLDRRFVATSSMFFLSNCTQSVIKVQNYELLSVRSCECTFIRYIFEVFYYTF